MTQALTSRSIRQGVAFVAAVLSTVALEAAACAVCFGEPDDPQTNGMNAAIGLLLVVVLAAGAALGALIRAASASANVPGDDGQPPVFPGA